MLLIFFFGFLLYGTFGQYGPGPNEWQIDSPEKHGLDSDELDKAARNVQEINERYCFLVVKDGVLVHETYWKGNKDTTHTAYSVGKTFASSLVGVAVTQGKLDIDIPLAEYGVTPKVDFGDYWEKVTTRTLLGQASGEGKYAPGTEFIYDSSSYIDHISYVLNKAVGEGTGKWGTTHLTEPLGTPGFWSTQQGDIQVGGGQQASCRDLARIGQLIINKGKWIDANGELFQLIDEKYIEEMTSPAYPSANMAYGFLTWVNIPVEKPQFWARASCTDIHSDGWPIGNGLEDLGAPADISVAMGYTGQYAMAIPSRNMVVVTMGNTFRGSSVCRPYDSHGILTSFYEAFGNLTIPTLKNEMHV